MKRVLSERFIQFFLKLLETVPEKRLIMSLNWRLVHNMCFSSSTFGEFVKKEMVKNPSLLFSIYSPENILAVTEDYIDRVEAREKYYSMLGSISWGISQIM